ncbi:DM13 domain-containing protein [archaeon]|nr:DM13 domain-containing protein [archaeon]
MNHLLLASVVFVLFAGTFASAETIPPWVKNNAQYWAQDAITDLDFINGIQYLITGGIIVIERDDEAPIQLSGIFVNGDFVHQISGSANVGFSGEKTILHLSDDFKTVSGPDLYVYLATDKQAKDHVNLGMIQKFSGLQSYDVPDDVDFEKYNEVLIWCKSFEVLFGNAPLQK